MLTTESKYSMTNLTGRTHDSGVVHELVAGHLEELARLATASIEANAQPTVQAIEVIAHALRLGGKVLACGNGGSASDAQHLVGELIGRVSFERQPLAAVSLTADSAVLTALGNDYGYDEVFARQVHGLGNAGDVLVALSTSGKSANIVAAVCEARRMGMGVVAMTGPSADPALELSDSWIHVESPETTHIQEIHSALIHTICLGVERVLRDPVQLT
jgi:phosphoheptose isomerase